jgi:hypothetical protein
MAGVDNSARKSQFGGRITPPAASCEAKHPETRHGQNQHTRSPQLEDSKSFADDTASKTRASRQTIERDARRGEKIDAGLRCGIVGKGSIVLILRTHRKRLLDERFDLAPFWSMHIRNGLMALALVLSLSACISSSDVVPMGPDTYMVSTHQQGGIASPGGLVGRSATKANAYCAAMSKQMVPDGVQSQQNLWFNSTDNTFMFRCYAANDARDQSPNLRPIPNAVIQVQPASSAP